MDGLTGGMIDRIDSNNATDRIEDMHYEEATSKVITVTMTWDGLRDNVIVIQRRSISGVETIARIGDGLDLYVI
jgi:hypothetical protein